MENKVVRISREALERHRNNTRKYLHLVENFGSSGQRIDPEATKAKIEEKYGLKLKPSEAPRTPTERVQPAVEKTSLDEHSIKELINSIRSKYCEKPAHSPPQVFFPRPISPETTVSAPTTPASAVTEAQLIELSPPKSVEAPDLISTTPVRKGYEEDLLCISFPAASKYTEPQVAATPVVAFPEPQVADEPVIASEPLLALEASAPEPFKKPQKMRPEDLLNCIISEVVGRCLRPQVESLSVSTEELPKRAVSPKPIRSFDAYLRNERPRTEEKKVPTVRQGKMKVTRAKVDPEALLSKDADLQKLYDRERRLLARLEAIAEEKRELLAALT